MAVFFKGIKTFHNYVKYINKKCMYDLCRLVCEHGLEGEPERDPGYGLEPAVGV